MYKGAEGEAVFTAFGGMDFEKWLNYKFIESRDNFIAKRKFK